MEHVYVFEANDPRYDLMQGIYTDFDLAVQAALNWVERNTAYRPDCHVVTYQTPDGDKALIYDKPDGRLIAAVFPFQTNYMFVDDAAAQDGGGDSDDHD